VDPEGVETRNDFSEGVNIQIPRNDWSKCLDNFIARSLMNDVRFRLDAYGYFNILCFYRVDAIDSTLPVSINKRWANFVQPNPLLNTNMYHIVQVLNENMKMFGDKVIIIKDEEGFTQSVISAVEKAGGECVIGDVRYHELVDRTDSSVVNDNRVTVVSEKPCFIDEFQISKALKFGCLDKYSNYKTQREWRICWLPKMHNCDPKMLHIENLCDFIEIISTEELEDRILHIFPGYSIGKIDETRLKCSGTLSYRKFKNKVEAIDGKCKIIFDLRDDLHVDDDSFLNE
jgi:hypothetical protein